MQPSILLLFFSIRRPKSAGEEPIKTVRKSCRINISYLYNDKNWSFNESKLQSE